MRISRSSKSTEVTRIRTYLAELVQEARERGDEEITLDVGGICLESGLNAEDAFALCCDVLDSDRFARTHGLWYHHRTGAWGTAEARYTFLLEGSGHRGATQGADSGRWSWARWILLALVAGAAAGVAGIVVSLLIG